MRLFHITTTDAWSTAQQVGHYRPRSLDTEGFIHLSTDAQWRGTAARFFAGQRSLVLLELDAARLGDVRFEPADGQLFPHLYAALEVSAVLAATPLEVSATGEVNDAKETGRLR